MAVAKNYILCLWVIGYLQKCRLLSILCLCSFLYVAVYECFIVAGIVVVF